MRALLLGIAVVAITPAVQVIGVNRLPVPGASPSLVLLAVVMLAAVHGPLPGAVTGFAAGLVLDLAPPADHVIGRSALALCLAGYVCGLLSRESPLWRLAAMAAGALTGTLVGLVAGLVLRDTTFALVVHVLPASLGYDVLAGPLLGLGAIQLHARPSPRAPAASYLEATMSRGRHV
jgi:rod shape-determining protein MreD